VDFVGASVGTSAVTVEVAGNDGTEQLSFAANTATSAVAFAVNQLKGATGVSALVNGGTLQFNSVGYGSDQFVSVKTIVGNFANGKGIGQDAGVNINGSRADVKGLHASVRSGDFDVDLILDKDFAQTVNSTGTSFDVVGGGAKFQIGSQVNRQGQINVGISSVSTTKLGDEVGGFLSSVGSGGANSLVSGNTIQAQKILTTAIRQVATLRGRLGALQKDVLNTNVNSLQTALENVTASESAIRDADFADETSKLTRSQILVQANTSVLAQANRLRKRCCPCSADREGEARGRSPRRCVCRQVRHSRRQSKPGAGDAERRRRFFIFPLFPSAGRREEPHPIPHVPGTRPQPHIPGAAEAAPDDLAPSAPTANTLKLRAVLTEPQSGHFTFSPSVALLIARTSFSNFLSQLLQVYS